MLTVNLKSKVGYKVIKVGLTGGIGSGKSTVSAILKNNKFKIIDADNIAKEVLEKNPQILDTVRVDLGEKNLEIIFLDFQSKELSTNR